MNYRRRRITQMHGNNTPAGTAPTYVQQVAQAAETGNPNDNFMTISIPAGGIAAGRLLVLGVGTVTTAHVIAVTDARSNTWTKAVGVEGAGIELEIWYSVLATELQAADLVTIDFGAIDTGRGYVLIEASSPAASPVDRTVSASGSSTAPASGSTAARSQKNELLLGFVVYDKDATESAYTDGAGGWTQGTLADTGDGSGLYDEFVIVPLRKAVTDTGTEGASGTLSASAAWAAAVVTLKGA